ncbi:hypothetical protein [Pontiella agarivorans]|uniref:Uncharacterized protein n=1 Tax=Pontiella agarivorans TaxID=3038953 RepID=A0ABU5MY33_9BACT|nr:hypothetical protein [Pontiella agarivorans]MDZ8119121.1 hypothetical protein [Pontiella agarivorans]
MKKLTTRVLVGASTILLAVQITKAAEPINISGVYPHLAMWNDEGECGTGAVVPWLGNLYAITYAPHLPGGSSDKLYIISPDLKQTIFEGSVGGTPANRMIHKESKQLLIGPYLVDTQANVRVIPPSKMYGRLTGTARHLKDPINHVYYATMEEGLYSVNIHTLEVETLIRDGNGKAPKAGIRSKLPGYHGKGLYTGQGRLIYSNNGQHSPEARKDPTTESGALAQWFGEGDWELVRRNQFTEITGAGGLEGNAFSQDPVWSMGWDARSVLLALLEDEEWTFYRLPKGSHSYDGAHGWNTEWPRIRDIGESDYLATMHGTFWSFPPTFTKANSAGIAPRSNYLKVIGDFCLWNNRLVLGCDDSARSEFLNKRSFKPRESAAQESNSNLWFINPKQLDHFGVAIGRGSVWLNDSIEKGAVSDPYLFSGYDYRLLQLKHDAATPITFVLEVDREGTNEWTPLRSITVPAKGAVSHLFSADEAGSWIRLKSEGAASGVTAHFHYRNRDTRSALNSPLFAGIVTQYQEASLKGVMRSMDHKTLGLALSENEYYELNSRMEWVKINDAKKATELMRSVKQPKHSYRVDDASVIVEEDGQRWRFPKNDAYSNDGSRVCREVATERDLLNLHGTFYELPARNAQGMAKVRPIATHNLVIHDFCSHAGLLLFTGLDIATESDHIFRSSDGKAAVWAGVVDDLWKLGKVRGHGGPWKNSRVKEGIPSDPYIMTAYDKKSVTLESATPTEISLEVDVDGTGIWVPYRSFKTEAGKAVTHTFPEGFSAYWVRAVCHSDTTATVQFVYE